MKSSRIFILGMVAFLLIMFIIEYNLPKKFVWIPTFSHTDHQPFGAAVFDDVLESSIPGYTVTDKTFYQLEKDSTGNRSYLVVVDRMNLGKVDINSMLSMAEKGSKFLLVASSFNKSLSDTLAFEWSYGHFSIQALKKYASSPSYGRDTIYWPKDSVYNYAEYRFYPHLMTVGFTNYDSLNLALSHKKKYDYEYANVLAIKQNVGKGKIVVASTPLLFTNYGILDGNNAAYLFRILSELKDLPIIRSEGYGKATIEEQQSPLRYFLSQAPLRWGLYTTIIVLLLFMFFTARRKQRVIPVMKEPENKSIEFMELIGTLYYQKKDHTDLIRKKYIYFAEILRRTIQVDIEDDSNDHELTLRIASKTGLEEGEILPLLKQLRGIMNGHEKVSEYEMTSIINKINKIINHL